MKRWLVRIAVCLILGAITTVVVAWACALWSLPSQTIPNQLDPERDHHMLHGPANGATVFRGLGTTIRRTDYGQYPMRTMIWRDRSGLPMYSMTGGFVFTDGGEKRAVTSLRLPDRFLGRARSLYEVVPLKLPLKPIWLGFFINTLSHAAIWFGLFFGFVSAKRFIRARRDRRRGRCPRCGYDLRGQMGGGCPECGWGRSTD